MDGKALKNIGWFFILVLLTNGIFGDKPTFMFLALVFFGMILFNATKYTVTIGTPEIMK